MDYEDPLSDVDVSNLRGTVSNSHPRPRGMLLLRCIHCNRIVPENRLSCPCRPDEFIETRMTREIVHCGICAEILPAHSNSCPVRDAQPEEYEVYGGGRLIVARYAEYMRNTMDEDDIDDYLTNGDRLNGLNGECSDEEDEESEDEGEVHYLRRSRRVYAGLGDVLNEEEDEEEEEYDADDNAFPYLESEIVRPSYVRRHPTPTRPVRH